MRAFFIGFKQAQARLWDDFANVVRETAERGPIRGSGLDRDRNVNRGAPDNRAGEQFRGRDDARRDGPSILDRLERRQEVLAQQSDRMNRLVTALRPLYAALSADQKRTADRELFQPRGDYGRGRFTRFDRPGNRPFYDREYR